MVCSAANDRDDDDLGYCRRDRCERALCPTDALDACAADHRRCFAACGGRVVEESR